MGKRGQNEGSIYKRADGRWAASISLGYRAGKQRRMTFYGKTRRDVQEQLTKALRDLQEGRELINPARDRLGVYLLSWVEDIIKPTRRASTYVKYAINIRKHIIPALGDKLLAKLTAQQVQAFYHALMVAGLAPRTIRTIHVTLHSALQHAVDWKLVATNVASLAKPPRIKRYVPQVFTAEQARQLLQAAKGHRHEALYILALTTGMREGELLGLHWADIDFEQGTIQLQRTLTRIWSFGFVEEEPKTESGRRQVVLTPLALAALRKHRARQLARRLKAGADWPDHDLVFCTRDGNQISVWTLYARSYLPLLTKAGLPRIRFHDLRHSAATFLLSLGVHPKVVQELLGHAGINITLDIYSHVLPSMQRDAVDRLGALLGDAAEVDQIDAEDTADGDT
jgi:integrase